jgi:hypothetical protein
MDAHSAVVSALDVHALLQAASAGHGDDDGGDVDSHLFGSSSRTATQQTPAVFGGTPTPPAARGAAQHTHARPQDKGAIWADDDCSISDAHAAAATAAEDTRPQPECVPPVSMHTHHHDRTKLMAYRTQVVGGLPPVRLSRRHVSRHRRQGSVTGLLRRAMRPHQRALGRAVTN